MSDLADFFAKDPLELTDSDITELVDGLRQRRSQFNSGAAKAGKMPKSSKEASEAARGLDLKSLGL